MTEFKNIFQEDVEIPEIVQAKARSAFHEIQKEKPSAPAGKTLTKKAGFHGRAIAAAAVACALMLGGGAAYAAGHFGLLDFISFHQEQIQIPEEAKNLIETVNEQEPISESGGAIMDCQVKEALCDSETITIVYEVTAREKGKYLFVPTDALPDDNMSSWSSITGKTAKEYAEEKGLTIVNIGGGIQNREELGIFTSTMDFRSASDDTMDIYVRSEKDTNVKNMEVSCIATAQIPDLDKVMKKEVRFTLEDKADCEQIAFTAENTSDEKSPYTIRRAEVIQTDLGTYIDVFYTVQNPDMTQPDIFFRIIREDNTELEVMSGSGSMILDDGTYRARLILNKTEIGDTITLEGFDPLMENKEIYGRTTLAQEG